MALKKYSELPAASTLAGTEIIAVTQSGSSVRTTAQAIANTSSTSINGSTGSTDNALMRADGTAGRTLQSTGVVVDDSNNMTGVVDLTATGTITGGVFKGAVQALTGPGAVNLTTLTTTLVTTGADALTLADGTAGQIKIIVMLTDGGDGTLTPTNFGNGTTITFADVGDSVMLQFLGSDWWIISNNGCAVA